MTSTEVDHIGADTDHRLEMLRGVSASSNRLVELGAAHGAGRTCWAQSA